MTSPFLKRPDVRTAIERLSEATALTIVVGAGASVEAALPDWRQLVDRLLTQVGRQAGCPEESLGQFSSWAMRSDGLPASGSMAKAWLGDRFIDEIRAELYRDSGDDPRPGQTALAVADLQRAFAGRSEIVTLNYDVLLERALRERGSYRASEVKTYVGGKKGASGAAVVRHLHGVLTPTRQRGTVVLSESDYHLMQDRHRWQEKYMRRRLESTTCLFIGTSLSDPNLLRYLYRSSPGAQHTAVFVRQGDDWWFDDDLADVRTAREKAVVERWSRVHVTPLLADYFAQSAQFVREVADRRLHSADYVSYDDRLRDWEVRVRKTLLRTSTSHFQRSQNALQTLLARWSAIVRDYLRDRDLLGAGRAAWITRLGARPKLEIARPPCVVCARMA